MYIIMNIFLFIVSAPQSDNFTLNFTVEHLTAGKLNCQLLFLDRSLGISRYVVEFTRRRLGSGFWNCTAFLSCVKLLIYPIHIKVIQYDISVAHSS